MQGWNRLSKCLLQCLLLVLLFASCKDSTEPARPIDTTPLAASEIDRLAVFVRDWPDRYVEIDFRRHASGNTLVVFRPSQPGVPRILLDSIGPDAEDPSEIVELLSTFNVWAIADSNAAGAACSTRSGQWVCNHTDNDYSLVMLVESGGMRRAQRYTRLGESGSNQIARALGDYVFAMMQRRVGSGGAVPR